MLLSSKKNISDTFRKVLIDHVYDVVGMVMDVCRQLPCGLPEYVYQEGFAKILQNCGINPHKEYRHHPLFDGAPMESFIKMDFIQYISPINALAEGVELSVLFYHINQ